MMRLRIEESGKDESDRGMRMVLVVETCRVDGESWMPTFEFDELGERRVCDGRRMRDRWNMKRERELRRMMYNRFSMPTLIDFERTVNDFLNTAQEGAFRRPILLGI